MSAGAVEWFTTLPMDTSSKWTVTVSGKSAHGVKASKVCEEVAKMMNIPTKRIIECLNAPKAPTAAAAPATPATPRTGGGRRLADEHTDTFTGVVAVDGRSTVLTSKIATLSTTDSAKLVTNVAALLPGYTVNALTYAAVANTGVVNWTGGVGPKFAEATTSTAKFTFAVDNTAGEVACVALKAKTQSEYKTNNNFKPTAMQVFLGTDNDNVTVPSAKVKAMGTDGKAVTSITISGLDKG